jgi:hypothetical protein
MEDFVVPIRIENKWTPGPWTTEADPDNESLLVNSMRGIVCGISLWEDDGPEAQARKKADARLIATAPEMADALQALVDECAEYVLLNNLHGSDGSPATTHSMRRARAALAKARGES